MLLKAKKNHANSRIDSTRIVLPFKDKKKNRQLRGLSKKIGKTLQPVFTSRKIEDDGKMREGKPPLINQQSVVYLFQCGLYDVNYVGYTHRHLFQRVAEHQSSAGIGNHIKKEHEAWNLKDHFTILKKCRSKLDSLTYEVL